MRAAWETHRDPQDPAAGIQLDGGEAMALAVAVEFYVARRFAPAELDTNTVVTMRAWRELADRMNAPEAGESGRTMVLVADDVRRLHEASGFYVAELDVEAYQPPELRRRLAVLHPLRCELGATLAAVPASTASPLDTLQLH